MIQNYNYNHKMTSDEVIELFIGSYQYHITTGDDIDELMGHTTLERFYGCNDKWVALVIVEHTIKRSNS